MGINRAYVRLLLDESGRYPFQSSMLELGKQDVNLTKSELQKYSELHGISIVNADRIALSKKRGRIFWRRNI